MGVLVRRCSYGAAVPNSKQQLIAAIAKLNEILRGSSKKSVNMSVEKLLKIIIISPSDTTLKKNVEQIDEDEFKELMNSKSFTVEMDLKRSGPAEPKIVFWYDEETHHGNSMNVEFVAEFPESVTFKMLGFLGLLNVPKSSAVRPVTESKISRIQSLWEDVFRMYVGGAMTKSEKRFNLRQYEIDSIYLNIFGNIIKVRED